MTIFETLAKTFGPKAKAPTVEALERAEREAEAAVTAARAALEALEGERVTAVVQGDAARTTFRAKLTTSRDDLEDAETALLAVRDRLEAARVEAAEKGRREVYTRAAAVQRAAADAMLAEYSVARDAILRLQRLVADADAAVEVANRDLPDGAERLLPEAEMLVRDAPGQAQEVVSRERVTMWVGAGGAPVDQSQVRSPNGRTGHMTVETGFGPHAIPVHIQEFERLVVKPWSGATYGARLRDLDLPPLRPEAPPAPAEVEKLEPISATADAAE